MCKGQEAFINPWLLYSRLRHVKRVGTWSGYLCTVALEDCVFSIGSCLMAYIKKNIYDSPGNASGMQWQNHHKEQGSLGTGTKGHLWTFLLFSLRSLSFEAM